MVHEKLPSLEEGHDAEFLELITQRYRLFHLLMWRMRTRAIIQREILSFLLR